MKTLRRGWAELDPSVQAMVRLPAGHPEGFFEAFANIYNEFANAVAAQKDGTDYAGLFPTEDAGVRGMNFIESVVSSARQNGTWVTLKDL